MADYLESFDDFKSSFAYGSRNDLSFKFLKRLDSGEAAEFVRFVLGEVGELFDGASPDRLIDLVYEWQVAAYQPRPGEKRPYTYDDRPFAPLDRALADTTVGLVTSSGHFRADEDPTPFGVADMSQEEAIERIDDFLRATPQLTVIPRGTPASLLRVRHPGYDVRSVSRDPGVAFPQTLLVEAEREGSHWRVVGRAVFVCGCVRPGEDPTGGAGMGGAVEVGGDRGAFLGSCLTGLSRVGRTCR